MRRGKGGSRWRDILYRGLRQTLSNSGSHSFLSWIVEYAATGEKRESRVGSGMWSAHSRRMRGAGSRAIATLPRWRGDGGSGPGSLHRSI